MKRSLLVLLVAGVAFQASAQVASNQPCPRIGVVQDFDLNKYSGLWYEVESYPAVFAKNRSCVTANYSHLPDGKIRVVNRSFNTSSRSFDTVEGIAAAVDPSKREARLAVAFPGNPFNRPPPPGGNYLVLGTDYTSFSIVWSCESLPGSDRSFRFLWHLSRNRLPSPADVDSVRRRIDSLGLDRKFLEKTDQVNCPAESQPRPTANSPVRVSRVRYSRPGK